MAPLENNSPLPPDIIEVVDSFYLNFTWMVHLPAPKTWKEMAAWAKEVTSLTLKVNGGMPSAAKSALLEQLAALRKELEED